jgi:glutamate---cysteine ligase / carboxylate-amine ligase
MLLPLAPPRAWPYSPLRVERCVAAFDETQSFTIGAEEELMLVHRGSGDLAHEVDRVLDRSDSRFAPELRAAQLEIITPVCATAADVCRELSSARQTLIERLPPELALLAAGTHPTSTSWGEITDAGRYRDIADEYAFAATRTLVCGLHVHVAVGGAQRALAIYNALRSFLPELAALAANSPFFEGRDTGMCSVRPKMNELYPRSGIPPAFSSWDELVRFLEWGRRGGLFPDFSYLWHEMRPHLRYGTLEIRVADTQTTVDDAAGYVALVQALVAWLADRFDAGEELPVHETYRIAENAWRAHRYGLGGWLVDLDSGQPQPTRMRIANLVALLEPYAARFGVDDKLPTIRTLLAGGGADRQRYVAAREGIGAVTHWLVRETEASAFDG